MTITQRSIDLLMLREAGMAIHKGKTGHKGKPPKKK